MKQEPIILALETATDACSVALLAGDQLFEHTDIAPKSHTKLIVPMMEDLLKQAGLGFKDLDLIAVGRGPGSFTGVRIAISLAQGLGFSLDKPVYPISTLEALAWQGIAILDSDEDLIIMPALDARMQEIYVGAYQWGDNGCDPLGPEILCKPQAILDHFSFQPEKLIAIGSGWDSYVDQLSALINQDIVFLPNAYPRADEVALIAKYQWLSGGKGQAAQDVLPIYLRDNVAQKSAKTSMRLSSAGTPAEG
jgi:tRNA threonylcarbamoyladenosine biosynthesis protein TsaB